MKKINKLVFVLMTIFFMTACSLESEFALSNDESLNQELLGTWYLEKDRTQQITIEKNNEKSYRLIFKDQDKTNIITSFSKTIQGFNIMNVEVVEQIEKINIFYGFEIKNNQLIFYEVNDALHKEPFKSQAELFKFFEKNINKKNFFINPTVLSRAI